MPELFDAKSFNAAEYDRAIACGTLGKMVFYATDRKDLEALRARVLSYSRTKGRNHVIQTTMLSENLLEVEYLGPLHR